MEPGQLLFSLLSQAAPVTALVGTRIYPVVAPQGSPRPYVCYQLISRVPDGSALCQLSDVARVQLSLFADTYAQVCQLAQACRGQLHYHEQPEASLELANEFDQPHDENAACYFRSQDYLVELH